MTDGTCIAHSVATIGQRVRNRQPHPLLDEPRHGGDDFGFILRQGFVTHDRFEPSLRSAQIAANHHSTRGAARRQKPDTLHLH